MQTTIKRKASTKEITTKTLSDSQLYKLCQEYGAKAKQWMRKFEGLLPEVYARRLYKRRGYGSIHEFAAKLAGMSHAKVDRVLRLSEKLKDKPKLNKLLTSGKVSYSKLESVAFIATSKTQEKWVKKVKELPKSVLDVCVREERKKQDRLSLTQGKKEEKSIDVDKKWNHMSFPISPELELKLRQLQQELEKEKGEKVTFNEVLAELFWRAENSKAPKQSKEIQLCPSCIEKETKEAENSKTVKRYIPAKVRQYVLTRQENKCSFPGCNKPPKIFHHTRRFALKRSHNPQFIQALCKTHESLAHAGLIENEEKPARTWKIKQEPDLYNIKNMIDRRVALFRGG